MPAELILFVLSGCDGDLAVIGHIHVELRVVRSETTQFAMAEIN